jgi:2-polyprenyl-3-methyl-5-hydroxy-6-metoxy-1,4-benzoquinol methylase
VRGTRLRGDAARHRPWQPEYPLRRDLDAALQRALAELALRGKRLVVADIGAGDKPWAEVIAPFARLHVGIDRFRTAKTDLIAQAEALPLRDVDVILCTQMLEHAQHPALHLQECYSVLKPNGIVVLTTHGTFVYHADPDDYWRFTHQGLQKLFVDAGFNVERILACEGRLTVAAFYASHALTTLMRSWTSLPTRLLVTAINLAARAIERGPRQVYSTQHGLDRSYGEIAMNYLVVARKLASG